jgi:outer membrane beta-barrel protein
VNRRTLQWVGCLAVTLSASGAFAQESELVEKVAVRNRLFTVDKRFELGANVGLTFLTRLTDHYTLNAAAAFNVLEWLAVEARVGYAISLHTSLANQIASDFLTTTSITKVNDLADLWEMNAHAIAGLRFQPIYGKINVVSELAIHFQVYAWLGAGAAMFKRESLLLCTAKSGSGCSNYYTQNKIGPVVSLALGFRFFIPTTTHHSVHVEFRDWSFLDSYYLNVDRATVTSSNPTSQGALAPNAGITNLTQWDIGYSYIF